MEFFDWGNKEVVNCDSLRELPKELLYVGKQCVRVSLNLVAGTRNKEAL